MRLELLRTKPERISYALVVATFILVGWLHLAPPLLVALFSYFALHMLKLGLRRKWLAAGVFLVLVAAVTAGFAVFVERSVDALPKVADQAIPTIVAWAGQYQIELPFSDFESLRTTITDSLKDEGFFLGKFAYLARGATTQIVLFVIGIVVAVSVFLNSAMELDRHAHRVQNNLYSLCCDEVAKRFTLFYRSFFTVMGAQITISAINTILTMAFVLITGLPHAVVIAGVTFLCGLLPVIGNLISNTVIVGIGFTVSPKMALAALIFLVVIHKLEYLLNSQIIGARIRNPIWLTLLGLIVGEKLMGIPGMILAPVVLHYVKAETAQVEVKPTGQIAPPSQSAAAGSAPKTPKL